MIFPLTCVVVLIAFYLSWYLFDWITSKLLFMLKIVIFSFAAIISVIILLQIYSSESHKSVLDFPLVFNALKWVDRATGGILTRLDVCNRTFGWLSNVGIMVNCSVVGETFSK